MSARRTASLSELESEVLEESEESARAYLRRRWLTQAVGEVHRKRIAAGLTQSEVAKKMATTQSAVARLERDRGGHVTLRRFIDYALACGVIPLEMEVAPFAEVRDFAATCPDSPLTAMAYGAWRVTQQAQDLSVLAEPCVTTGKWASEELRGESDWQTAVEVILSSATPPRQRKGDRPPRAVSQAA